jgi:conjugal transfer pilus assembly protein TraV
MNPQRPTSLALQMVLIASVLTSLAGCSSMFNPVGENKYDCNRKENPDSPYCHSFRSVEQATSSDIPDSRYDGKMNIEDVDKLTGIAPVKKSKSSIEKSNDGKMSIVVSSSDDQRPVSTLPAGTPVRIGPVVQRVWIKSFSDKNDMLASDQIIYKEVVPTHWAGEAANQNIQGITSGGLPGAYPHKPVMPSSPVLNTTPTPALEKENNPSFNQPGTQGSSGETASALSDNSAQTMPN